MGNKARLLVSPTFLRLALEEALGSISKSLLATRVRRFLPSLGAEMLVERGTAGIRSPIIDRHGTFIKEVLELEGPVSTHVLNYNSPGATGAPAYAAFLTERLEVGGYLEHLKPKSPPISDPWNLEEVVASSD